MKIRLAFSGYYWMLGILLTGFCVISGCNNGKGKKTEETKRVKLVSGVSAQLARHRAHVISQLSYTVDYDIAADPAKAIQAHSSMHFNFQDSLARPLQIDFKQTGVASVKKMVINGTQVVPNYQKEHIIIDASQLQKGPNQIDFEFQPGEDALNRTADYMYTLFVPDRARTALPCFDQPDLKAIFKLTLHIDTSWQAIANGALLDSTVDGSRKTLHFAPSDSLSTYLFAFVAGRFKVATGRIAGHEAKLLYRENDPAKIKASLQQIFALSDKAVRFYEKWTGIAYPFHNMGMAAIPNFQFGGMEHPGNILYQSSTLFLDPVATASQLNNRSNLLAHELAHMWFGDLVTMRWFNDVWMKEVFANFMADKCMRPAGSDASFNHKFLIDHYPQAYDEDRTAGATPIRGELDNLQNAGLLYGNIIYHKAPIMMRQLEQVAGAAAFQRGVKNYLKDFQFGNAGWPQLIELIDRETPEDLLKWNKVWVKRAGRPEFDYHLETKNGSISKLLISQHPEVVPGKRPAVATGTEDQEDTATDNQKADTSAVWPQVFDITLFYPNAIKVIGVKNGSASMEVKAAEGQRAPLFILFNSNGMGYGRFPASGIMATHLNLIGTPLPRASAYINLYEQMLAGKKSARGLTPQRLLKAFMEATKTEKDELNTKLLLNYIKTIYWDFLPAGTRDSLAPVLETVLWSAMTGSRTANIKKLYFEGFSDIFLSKEALARLQSIWQLKKAPTGISLYEEDYTQLAVQLALRIQDHKANRALLDTALARITNPDKKASFKIVMQAASCDPDQRDQFFKAISDPDGRKNERAVLSGLYLLNHPLRQPESEKYIKPGLKMLEDIQATGTIFFPKGFMSALLYYYNSTSARSVLNEYLDEHAADQPKLTEKLLQASDLLRRSNDWVYSKQSEEN